MVLPEYSIITPGIEVGLTQSHDVITQWEKLRYHSLGVTAYAPHLNLNI